MNLPLFVEHLHQTLQQDTDHLEAVRDLLRVHISKNLGGEPFSEEKGFPPNPPSKKTLTSDEEVAVRIVDCVCAILLRHRDEKFASERRRRAKAVRAIINSLSFSELEAMSHVLTSLGSPGGGEGVFEGVLVAGQIADGLGLARSVVTSALRKLEGANLIETRSLGMKGTYIRVKDALLVEELAKL